MRRFRGCVLLFISILIGGCTTNLPGTDPLVTRLKDRGIVPVSSDNPFLATNLLLTKATAASPEIKGFLEHKGNPAALSVEKSPFGPMMLTLYYPEVGQFFIIEDEESLAIIRGPFPISANQKTQLSALGEEVKEVSKKAQEPTPTQFPTSTPVPKVAPFRSPPQPSATPAQIKSPELIVGDEAEITPRGDVVHYITKPDENINDIAAWYTDDKSNGEKLMRLNNLTDLEVGDTVVIPSYLVKRKVRMP